MPGDGFVTAHVHAGYGEQWIKALEPGIDIIPNPLKGPLLPRMAWHCYSPQVMRRRSRISLV
jgi:hypothetical protein